MKTISLKILLFVLLVTFYIVAQAQPTITSFTPTAGPVGTAVTITGTNFNTTPANNTVFFGAVRASVSASTITTLTVIAPAGATYQPIVVINNGLLAYSNKPFIVTFTVESIAANSFAGKTDFTTEVDPSAMTVGDWDGDGKMDMAVAGITAATSSATLSIYRNNSTGPGNINYEPKIDFNLGSLPAYSIVTGDFDGDGKLDLVTSNWSSAGIISFFRNTSTGAGNINFASRLDFPGGFYPISLSVADLDRDGKVDVAVANVGNSTSSTGNVFIYRNTSSGSGNINFATKIDFVTGNFPESIAMGDLDGDGSVDMILAKRTTGGFAMRNISTGPGNINFAGVVNFTTGNSPYSVSIGDVDGDGKDDVVTPNRSTNTISVIRSTSTGPGNIGFAANVDFGTGDKPIYSFASDLDGDGDIDFATANQEPTVSVLRNTSTIGSINFDTKVDYATGCNPQELLVTDMDGDFKPDIVVVNRGAETVSVLNKLISSPPTITFSPTSGVVGTTIVITGLNFSPTPANNVVKFFNDRTATVTASSATSITTKVPSGTVSGKITVTTNCVTLTSDIDFTFGAALLPTITSLTPSSGPIGTTVTITGTNFSTTPANNTVKFNGTTSVVTASTATSITTTVPAGATTGKVSVTVGGNTAISTNDFTVTSASSLTITSFTPTSGPVTTIVTITGTNFSTTPANNTVKFNGTISVVTASTTTSITTTVPTGAITGKISVTVGGNTATSTNDFTVTTASFLTITSFTPTSGPVNTIVTITGTNFSTTATSNTVKFNGTTSVVTASTTTSITTTVPTGATTGKISVTVASNIATSANDFTVTTSGGAVTINVEPLSTSIGGTITKNLVPLITTLNGSLDINSITITVQPPSGAVASISNGSLTVDYTNISFSGKESITIRACDTNGNCATQQFEIEVAGDVVVYNAVSPDGKNPILRLEFIDTLSPKNQVSIYNRWGDEVFSISDYDNKTRVFAGLTNGGSKLPAGTYFYKIVLADAGKTMTGFLSLKY
jgi:gliding motility-associated-like protein